MVTAILGKKWGASWRRCIKLAVAKGLVGKLTIPLVQRPKSILGQQTGQNFILNIALVINFSWQGDEEETSPQQEKLLAAIPELLAHQVQPSLVHGDLWGGNAGCTASGEPVIFDPATYFGDREVDIAMTELFGGFPAAFYKGYNEVFPLDAGYEQRKTLYNLYHILNHFNLFGGSYASQANRMIDQILR